MGPVLVVHISQLKLHNLSFRGKLITFSASHADAAHFHVTHYSHLIGSFFVQVYLSKNASGEGIAFIST